MRKAKRTIHVSRADAITLANAVFGIIAIWYFSERQFLYGCTFLILAMVADGLDGYAARRWGSSHSLGSYLDSMADAISFALAPAFGIYSSFYDTSQASSLTLESPLNTLTVLATLAYAVAGLIRLARFTKSQKDLSYFMGLATPLAAGMMVFFILLFGRSGYYGYFGFATMPFLVLPCVLVVAALMLAPIKMPKVRGKIVIPFAVTLIAMGFIPIGSYFLVLPSNESLYVLLTRIASSIALLIFALYILVCPILVHTRRIL